MYTALFPTTVLQASKRIPSLVLVLIPNVSS